MFPADSWTESCGSKTAVSSREVMLSVTAAARHTDRMSDREAGRSTGDGAFVRFLKRKWLAIVLVVLLVVIAVQNGVADDQATIFVFWGQVQLPTWLLIVIVFLIGGITGWILARNRAARKARRARR